MSNLTKAQRDKLPDSAFCGPGRTYPILDSSDVRDGARLIGQAASSAQPGIKTCIIRKAKRFGWKLPAAWQDGGKGG